MADVMNFDLKSNMDRFIESGGSDTSASSTYLKSNMDRYIGHSTTAARRTVPASNAFVPAACGLVCGSEVVKDLLRKGGVYRGTK